MRRHERRAAFAAEVRELHRRGRLTLARVRELRRKWGL
jgi:hypothetical protein